MEFYAQTAFIAPSVFCITSSASRRLNHRESLPKDLEGITKIEDGMMTLSVETECRQADTHKVKLYVYGELQKLFARNGIRI